MARKDRQVAQLVFEIQQLESKCTTYQTKAREYQQKIERLTVESQKLQEAWSTKTQRVKELKAKLHQLQSSGQGTNHFSNK